MAFIHNFSHSDQYFFVSVSHMSQHTRSGPEDIKKLFILKSAKHEIYSAHKCQHLLTL